MVHDGIYYKEIKMSYLFPEGSTTERGVVEVGSNINVLDGVISIPQSVATTANITFNDINADGNLNVAGNVAVIGNIDAPLSNISGAALFDNTNRVVTSVTPSAGNGISLTTVTTSGPSTSFTVNNTGVLSLIAGTGITLSGSTGDITVSATGADFLNTVGVTANYTATATDEYIGVNSTSLVTVTLPVGITGRQYIIKEERGTGTGKVNVQGTSSETIDGSPFKQLTANASLTVVFRAGTWRII
jgi:hypothetical protein